MVITLLASDLPLTREDLSLIVQWYAEKEVGINRIAHNEKYMFFIKWFKTDLEAHQGEPSHLPGIFCVMSIIRMSRKISKLIVGDETGWPF
jgi:hypothetical protein